MIDKSEKIVIKFRRRKVEPYNNMVDAHIHQENIIMLVKNKNSNQGIES